MKGLLRDILRIVLFFSLVFLAVVLGIATAVRWGWIPQELAFAFKEKLLEEGFRGFSSGGMYAMVIAPLVVILAAVYGLSKMGHRDVSLIQYSESMEAQSVRS